MRVLLQERISFNSESCRVFQVRRVVKPALCEGDTVAVHRGVKWQVKAAERMLFHQIVFRPQQPWELPGDAWSGVEQNRVQWEQKETAMVFFPSPFFSHPGWIAPRLATHLHQLLSSLYRPPFSFFAFHIVKRRWHLSRASLRLPPFRFPKISLPVQSLHR